MFNPKVAIVILNYNGLEDTKNCLKSLLKTRYSNFRIIVVDNGSITNEAKILKKIFSNRQIKFLRFNKNLGFSGGNNRILKKVKDKYVILLNNDTKVTPNWLSPLIKIMEKDKSIAVVQPKILWLENKKYFDYAGACGGFIDIFGYPFTRGRIFDTIEEDKGQYDSVCDIFWASGAAMAIRTNIFKKVGYFDELFFNYMEEIDLCCRINQAGYRILCEPKSTIYHKVAGSASKNQFKKRFWEHRNNLLLMLKNYPLNSLLVVIPFRTILELTSFFYYLFQKRFDFAAAVLKSQLSMLFLSPRVLVSRLKLRKENKVKPRLIYKSSIIFSYFLLGKTTFSHIFRISEK